MCMRFLLAFLLALPLWAVTLSRVPGEEGKTLWQVEHPRYRLAFVEDPGGWCVEFHFPKDGPNWVTPGPSYEDGGTLFAHLLSGQGWGGNKLGRAPRRIEVVEETPERLQLRFTGQVAGEPTIVHTMTFADNTTAIRVDVEVRNESSTAILAGLWAHHHFAVGGHMLKCTFYRPGPHGVMPIGHIPPAAGETSDSAELARQARAGVSNDFLRRPTAGWTATVHQPSRRGLVFLMDYNYLNTLYNCVPYSTTEWFYDKTPIAAGKSWQTTYWAIPVEGLASVAHAAEPFICELQVVRKEGQAQLTGRLVRGVAAPASLRLELAYRQLFGDSAMQPLPAVEVPALEDGPATFAVLLPTAPPGKSLVFDLTFSGENFSDATQWLAIEDDAVSFDLIAGKTVHHFNRTPPPKHKVFEKPKNMRVMTEVGCPLLELRGPGHYRTGVTTAATLADVFEIRGSYMEQSFDGVGVDYFPASYEELFEYNLISLNNVPVGVLQPYAQEMVKDFVEAGGGLLIFGGSDSLSNGGYHQGPISEVLPVELTGKPFNWQQLPAGAGRRLAKAPDARILRDVDIPPGMTCEWAEPVTLAENCWAEMTVGEHPFIVCGEFKSRWYTGRVAVVAGSVFGTAADGFWNHPEWPRILGRIVDWVNHEAHIREPNFVP